LEQFGKFRFQALESSLLPLTANTVDAALQDERAACVHGGHFARVVEDGRSIRPSKRSPSPFQLGKMWEGPCPPAVNHVIFDRDGRLFHRMYSVVALILPATSVLP
jgi:hypothetical protein